MATTDQQQFNGYTDKWYSNSEAREAQRELVKDMGTGFQWEWRNRKDDKVEFSY